jgi:RNA polymerase sigma-70 factor, ECF subfamily
MLTLTAMNDRQQQLTLSIYQTLSQPTSRSASEKSKKNTTTYLTAQFELFFKRFERQIVRHLCRMVRDEQAAYDLSQETFVKAWQHFDRLHDDVIARAWLYRVSTNLALNYLKRLRIHPPALLDEYIPGDGDPGQHIAESDRIQTILMVLKPKQRDILILHDVHGFSCTELSDLVHLSYGNVKKILERGRRQFRITYLQENALKP